MACRRRQGVQLGLEGEARRFPVPREHRFLEACRGVAPALRSVCVSPQCCITLVPPQSEYRATDGHYEQYSTNTQSIRYLHTQYQYSTGGGPAQCQHSNNASPVHRQPTSTTTNHSPTNTVEIHRRARRARTVAVPRYGRRSPNRPPRRAVDAAVVASARDATFRAAGRIRQATTTSTAAAQCPQTASRVPGKCQESASRVPVKCQ